MQDVALVLIFCFLLSFLLAAIIICVCSRLLVATGSDKEKRSHVITIDYNNTKTAQKAVTLPEKEIMSIRLISETEVLLGTLHGSLYKMSLEGNNDFSKLLQFPADTILSIVGCTPEYQSEVIMLGMASGTLVCIDKEQLLCNQNLTSYSSGIYIFKLASDLRSDTAETPICNLINTKEHLVWISCGSQLLYYEVFLTDLTLSDSRDTVEMADSDPRSYLCNSRYIKIRIYSVSAPQLSEHKFFMTPRRTCYF